METKIIQITSGRGPVECCRVVARVLELMLEEARKTGLAAEVLETRKGDLNGTLLSAVIRVNGKSLEAFTGKWQGTVQWIAQSPYRKLHRRKNWFVGVELFGLPKELVWHDRDVVFETCRASGPGGQHVNKVETAVRGIHKPTGLQVLAMDSRSQLQNKQLCLKRLKAKVAGEFVQRLLAQQQSRWQEHEALERGNPVMTIQARL